MKLFMRNFYDQPGHLAEIKNPLEYEVICIACAGILGGKMDRWVRTAWQTRKCSMCDGKKEVTSPRNYVWRA